MQSRGNSGGDTPSEGEHVSRCRASRVRGSHPPYSCERAASGRCRLGWDKGRQVVWEKHTRKRGCPPDGHLRQLAQLHHRHRWGLSGRRGPHGGGQVEDDQVNRPLAGVAIKGGAVGGGVADNALHLWGDGGV